MLRVRQVRVRALGAHAGRDRHDRQQPLRVVHRQLERRAAAHAVTDHVGAFDAEVVEQADDVARQVGVGEVPVDVGGASMGLEVDADHPVVLRQCRKQ